MNKSWKIFTIVISALLAVIVICTAVNVSVGKITAGLSPQQGSYTDNNGTPGVDVQNNNPAVIPNNPVQSDTGGNSVPGNTGTGGNNNTVQTPQQTPGGNAAANGSSAAQASDNPLSYDKAQLVNYYNQCLRKAYSQPKFTVQKTEVVDVQLGQMMLNGKPATNLQSTANKIVAKNKEKGGTDTQSFTNKTAVVDAQKRFILPANLYPAAVSSATVSKNGQGYVIKFTLNQENCDFRTKPPYNSSCTFPLDFNEIDLGNIGQITSAQFNYPGTTLTATIDGQGRVVKTYVEMPLYVKNATGQGMGQTLNMDISGRWLCTNINTF